MGTAVHPADEALRKAQLGEPLNVNDRCAIHRRLLHLRNAADLKLTDDLKQVQELSNRYNWALSTAQYTRYAANGAPSAGETPLVIAIRQARAAQLAARAVKRRFRSGAAIQTGRGLGTSGGGILNDRTAPDAPSTSRTGPALRPAYPFSTRSPITRRWISLVPS